MLSEEQRGSTHPTAVITVFIINNACFSKIKRPCGEGSEISSRRNNTKILTTTKL